MRNDVEMSFGDHLDELRRRVIYAVVGLVVAAAICGVNYDFLLKALMRPYSRAYKRLIAGKLDTKKPLEGPDHGEKRPPLEIPDDTPLATVLRAIEARLADLEKRLDAIAPEPEAGPDASEEAVAYAQRFPAPRVIQGGPLTGYITAILLCVICGIILGSPWILYQIWAFVGVGLYAHERRYVHIYGPFSFFLFVAGAATFYFIMLPTALGALMAPTAGIMVDGLPIIDPSFFLNDYFKFVAMMTLIFGVVFQTPLVVMFIAWTRIVSLGTLFRKQKIVILVLAIASAVLTPQDPVTMVMMAIPLVLLYWLGLLLAWITMRGKKDEDEGNGWGGDEGDSSLSAPPTDEGAGGDGAALPSPQDETAEGETTDTETAGDDLTETDTPGEGDDYRDDDLYEYEREYGQYDDEDLYGYDEDDYDYGTGEDATPEDDVQDGTQDESDETSEGDAYGYPPGRNPYEDAQDDDGYGDEPEPDHTGDDQAPDAEPSADAEPDESPEDDGDTEEPDDAAEADESPEDDAVTENPDDTAEADESPDDTADAEEDSAGGAGPDDGLPPEDRMK